MASLTIREVHIKTTVRTTAGPLRWLGGESEKCWRGAERLEASYTVAQRNGAVTLEGSLAVPQKVRVIIWLCSSPFRCINKRNENYCSHRNPYTHVYSSILYHNRQKAGTTHRPSTWKADQSNVDVMLGIIMKYYLVIKKRKAHVTPWMKDELAVLTLSEGGQSQKATCYSISLVRNVQD